MGFVSENAFLSPSLRVGIRANCCYDGKPCSAVVPYDCLVCGKYKVASGVPRCPYSGVACDKLSVDCRDCSVWQANFSPLMLRNIIISVENKLDF